MKKNHRRPFNVNGICHQHGVNVKHRRHLTSSLLPDRAGAEYSRYLFLLVTVCHEINLKHRRHLKSSLLPDRAGAEYSLYWSRNGYTHSTQPTHIKKGLVYS